MLVVCDQNTRFCVDNLFWVAVCNIYCCCRDSELAPKQPESRRRNRAEYTGVYRRRPFRSRQFGNPTGRTFRNFTTNVHFKQTQSPESENNMGSVGESAFLLNEEGSNTPVKPQLPVRRAASVSSSWSLNFKRASRSQSASSITSNHDELDDDLWSWIDTDKDAQASSPFTFTSLGSSAHLGHRSCSL
jgi:hypothetical protein